MSDALTTLLDHGYGHLRRLPTGGDMLTLTFTPQDGESLADLEARVRGRRCPDDTVEVVVRGGRITRIDLIRQIS